MYLSKESKSRFLELLAFACLTLLGSGHNSVHAFAPSSSSQTEVAKLMSNRQTKIFSSSMLNGPEIGFDKSCVMTKEEIAPIVTLKEGEPKEKMVNAWGFYCIFVSLLVNPIWSLAMFITNAVCESFEDLDTNRAFYDKTGKIWAKAWLSLTDSYPTISGDIERLKEDNDLGACLFVANHASWLDIPVLCTILDPVFKFIAKGELKSVPCIGQQLVGVSSIVNARTFITSRNYSKVSFTHLVPFNEMQGKHIMIDREDRRSQLRTFKEGVGWLKSGMSLMAFPEGKRSDDGRLDEFKGGIFSMAVKAGVPIVPISISNTHAVMPANALFPVQKGKGLLHLHVHEPISVEGKKEDELAALVKEALLLKMPLDQHPLPKPEDENNTNSVEVEVKRDLQKA